MSWLRSAAVLTDVDQDPPHFIHDAPNLRTGTGRIICPPRITASNQELGMISDMEVLQPPQVRVIYYLQTVISSRVQFVPFIIHFLPFSLPK